MKFCPQCGTTFVADDRFCQNCGYDKLAVADAREEISQPLPPPPVAEVIAEPVHTVVPAEIPITKPAEPPAKQRGRKKWIIVMAAVFGVGAIVAAGWFGYSQYRAAQTKAPVAPVALKAIPKIAATDTNAANAKITTPPVAALPAQQNTLEKQKSTSDKKTVKPQTGNPTKPAQATNTQPSQKKSDPGVQVATAPSKNDYPTEVILRVGKKDDSNRKNPKNPVKLTIKRPTTVVRITTDHYNEGAGTGAAGSITLCDKNGGVIGTYKAIGAPGIYGAKNVKWVAEPRKLLQKGTYFIWDSDMSTWSKTMTGAGFVVVEGYEVK